MNHEPLVVNDISELPADITIHQLAEKIVFWLEPWGDSLEETIEALSYALSNEPGKGGFLLLTRVKQQIEGALVMLNTGMGGYIPRYHLVYIGVSPEQRGQGRGETMIQKAIQIAKEPISLHIDKDNPATALYERIGFKMKYLEMRTE